MTKSPKRPHPYQISDSEFTVEGDRVIETWWAIANAHGDKEDMRVVWGPYADAARVAAEWRTK